MKISFKFSEKWKCVQFAVLVIDIYIYSAYLFSEIIYGYQFLNQRNNFAFNIAKKATFVGYQRSSMKVYC